MPLPLIGAVPVVGGAVSLGVGLAGRAIGLAVGHSIRGMLVRAVLLHALEHFHPGHPRVESEYARLYARAAAAYPTIEAQAAGRLRGRG